MICTPSLSAQMYEKPPIANDQVLKHLVFVELGGSSGFASVNYELVNSQGYTFRMGISPIALLWNDDDSETDQNYDPDKGDLVALLALSKIFGQETNHFETGLGYVFGQSYRDENDRVPLANGFTPYCGYRMMSPSQENRYILRLTFSPIINSEGINPWFGISFGYSL